MNDQRRIVVNDLNRQNVTVDFALQQVRWYFAASSNISGHTEDD